ncbi:exopolysaccharide biosynthesis polyprenyl glycosylphosphotransferase [Zunongwangia sp. F260]|uniref:Exopolysaccharide biosynthesis polyprenyl glycosylphosphotransferase n=1 Tax=Autumnicola lenta TaxID=3075593 RepID=A0ABU3CJE9_9FLAO|nr:exopolysaccharide biosynthesis polyprenyl glycosylphosphotransferase [Zunongwangia sp. F260]MDT0646075.1 exopolysaccharide biosynthesis polyprenyl glycosylphosphotransferase [Zunongwangia sp. F260]
MKKSAFIIPISIAIHLIILNGTLLMLTSETYLDTFHIFYYNIVWLLITYSLNFYPTARKEKFMHNFIKMVELYIIFGLSYFALFSFEKNQGISPRFQLYVLCVIFTFLTLYRWMFYWLRSKYRLGGGNYVNVIVIGRDKNLKKIRKVFEEPELGYRYKGYFDHNYSSSPTYLGPIEACYEYVLKNMVDEIYCMVSKLSHDEIKQLMKFADNSLIKLKIIPDNKEIFTHAMTIELYDTIPVLNMRKLPMETEFALLAKRTFDILFSSLVLIFILSWLTPLLYVLIKMESPGPLFFKQERNGVKRRVFWCHKFRSMTTSSNAHTSMAIRNDIRITRIGKFMRKTSIDELPQFIDVFFGDMSVVGPRPHMKYHTSQYESSVDKYLVRHFVKPGITGLAQIKGYRGEIMRKADIINRVRFDIFYIEKWSLLLDIRIVFQTVVNAFRGDDKAY